MNQLAAPQGKSGQGARPLPPPPPTRKVINLNTDVEIAVRLAAIEATLRTLGVAIERLAIGAFEADSTRSATRSSLNRIEIVVARIERSCDAMNATVAGAVAAVRRVIDRMQGRTGETPK